MSENPAPNASAQIETEYYVTFFETKYPVCRRGVYDDVDYYPWRTRLVYNDETIKLQRDCPCFSSCCEKEECYQTAPNCYWNCTRDLHVPIECDEDSESVCWSFPFKCATDPCPDAVRELLYCVSVGLLTPEELEAFRDLAVELKNTNDDYGYLLQSREKIGVVPLVARAKYGSAVKKLEKISARNFSTTENPIAVLERYEEYADGIRAARKSPPSSVVDPIFNVLKSANLIQVTQPPERKPKPQKTRKPRRLKYEDAVENYLHDLVRAVRMDDTIPEFATNLSYRNVAAVLHTRDEFKTYKKNGEILETLISSVENGVRHSKAWQNRFEILQQINGIKPPSLGEVYDKRTHTDTVLPPGVNEVDCHEEYEDPVEEYLRALHKNCLFERITPEQYCAQTTELTPKTVAKWLKENKTAFEKRSIATIENGVQCSMAWINREEILNVEAHAK